MYNISIITHATAYECDPHSSDTTDALLLGPLAVVRAAAQSDRVEMWGLSYELLEGDRLTRSLQHY